jgi:hypothetical protein
MPQDSLPVRPCRTPSDFARRSTTGSPYFTLKLANARGTDDAQSRCPRGNGCERGGVSLTGLRSLSSLYGLWRADWFASRLELSLPASVCRSATTREGRRKRINERMVHAARQGHYASRSSLTAPPTAEAPRQWANALLISLRRSCESAIQSASLAAINCSASRLVYTPSARSIR